MNSQRFPWAQILQLGIGRMHLSPDQFWRSTLRELVIGAGFALASASPLQRLDLFNLMETYPDAE